MKEKYIRIIGLLIMWLMIILTTIQSDTILWVLLAISTFVVIYIVRKWTKVTYDNYYGIQFHKSWLKFLMLGIALGSGYSIIRFLLLYSTGALNIINIFHVSLSTVLIPIIFLIVSNSYIAFSEEMVFRGYIFNALPDKLKGGIIIIISSLLFLLGHSINGIFSISRIIELLFLGLTLSLIYFGTKSLWAAIGMHFGLDFFSFFLGGDGDISRQYILLSEKTNNYKDIMRLIDSILPIVIFLVVILIIRSKLFSTSNRVLNNEGKK